MTSFNCHTFDFEETQTPSNPTVNILIVLLNMDFGDENNLC